MIQEKVLKTLEFDKIEARLSSMTTGGKSREVVAALRPMRDFRDVSEALDETDEAVRMLLKYGAPPHIGIFEQDLVIGRALTGGVLSAGELLQIAAILRVTEQYANYCEDPTAYPILSAAFENLIPYASLEQEISTSIRSEDEVADSASAALASIRRNIRNLNSKIRDTLNGYLTSPTFSKYLQEAIVTTRNGRYVIPVKSEHKGDVKGLVHDTSSTGATLFIEPIAVVEANNKLRQEEVKEKNEIQKILSDLSVQVARYGESILENMRLLVQLDVAFAKGKLALDMHAIRPTVRFDGVISLKKARHPLIDREKVVPVDVQLGEAFDTLVITGPNTGGKTAVLKTVGLLTLMAQAGLHIPVSAGSEISVFDNVFADIGDEQSIEQSLSTFSAHMTNIVSIMEQVDTGSLVLFDELGAGTDPTEGAALATAILEQARMCGAKTIATTHYSELKVYATVTERVENGSCEFNVETLRPTYRLIIGIPGKSNAFAISEKIGLQKEIIQKAETYLTSENIRFEDVLSELERNRQQAQKEHDQAQKMGLQAKQLKGEAEKARKQTEQQRQKILEDAAEQAQKLIDNAEKQVDEMLRHVQKMQKANKEKETVRALEQIRKELKGRSEKLERKKTHRASSPAGKAPKEFLPGTEVYIPQTDTNGVIVSPPDKKGNILVQTGVLKMTVPASSLRAIEQNDSERIARQYAESVKMAGKSEMISPELDVRGLYADDAIEKVDRFIHDATVANLKTVTIIHGKGTGVLRKEIHAYLKSHPYVEDFRSGRFGEGDIGVTVVELK